MQIKLETQAARKCKADLLILPLGADGETSLPSFVDPSLRLVLASELSFHGFTGKEGESVLLQTHATAPWRYLVVTAQPEAGKPRAWYALAQCILNKARDLKAGRVLVSLPPARLDAKGVFLLSEGLRLAAYRFDTFKSKPRPAKALTVSILCDDATKALRRACAHGVRTAEATCLARDLIQTPAAVATPRFLAEQARAIARAQGLRLKVLDAKAMRAAGMGALLGVAQGSAEPPRFLELVYKPAKKPSRRVALVGKGITFDTGGLSLKPADSMQSQKRDMAGGGAVLGVMSAIRDLEIGAEVRAYIPCAENMPSGTAIRPGDVLRTFSGKTVEVLNTDAEGRLVLADALAYAAREKPDLIVDFATLTAAVRIALGTRYAGIMGTDAGLVRQLIDAGAACGENLWELPLVQEYRADIDSQVADLRNIGDSSTGAGTILGGLFLREFVGDIPWCHVDFSSTVVADKPFPCHPRGATGFGVRTMLRFLTHLGGDEGPDGEAVASA